MQDTKVGSSKKDDAAMVAKTGFGHNEGLGRRGCGLKNKAQAAMADAPRPCWASSAAR